MMNNRDIFWDKKISTKEVKQILQDINNVRFGYLAAILLSRTSDVKLVFDQYLDKKIFVANWQKIKRKMRENKWSDSRIIFWDAVCQSLKKQKGLQNIKPHKEEKEIVSEQLQEIGSKIRTARTKKHMTQSQLAQQTKISQQTISIIERGYANVAFATLGKVAKAVGLIINIGVEDNSMMQYYSSTSTSL